MIIFYHKNELNLADMDYAEIYEEEQEIKELFFDRTSLSDSEKQQVREKIFVSINSEMFKIDNDQFDYNKEWFMTKKNTLSIISPEQDDVVRTGIKIE